jgi:hypothetical protein
MLCWSFVLTDKPIEIRRTPTALSFDRPRIGQPHPSHLIIANCICSGHDLQYTPELLRQLTHNSAIRRIRMQGVSAEKIRKGMGLKTPIYLERTNQ